MIARLRKWRKRRRVLRYIENYQRGYLVGKALRELRALERKQRLLAEFEQALREKLDRGDAA